MVYVHVCLMDMSPSMRELKYPQAQQRRSRKALAPIPAANLSTERKMHHLETPYLQELPVVGPWEAQAIPTGAKRNAAPTLHYPYSLVAHAITAIVTSGDRDMCVSVHAVARLLVRVQDAQHIHRL